LPPDPVGTLFAAHRSAVRLWRVNDAEYLFALDHLWKRSALMSIKWSLGQGGIFTLLEAAPNLKKFPREHWRGLSLYNNSERGK